MSYYKVLNIDESAKEDEIKKAYRQKVLEYHPDRTTYEIEAAREKFRELDEAYKVLSKDDRRALYDVFHRHKEELEKNPYLNSKVLNLMKQMYINLDDEQNKNSLLNDAVLNKIPAIDFDKLIRLYNARHSKREYYDHYKDKARVVVSAIESQLQEESTLFEKQRSSKHNSFQAESRSRQDICNTVQIAKGTQKYQETAIDVLSPPGLKTQQSTGSLHQQQLSEIRQLLHSDAVNRGQHLSSETDDCQREDEQIYLQKQQPRQNNYRGHDEESYKQIKEDCNLYEDAEEAESADSNSDEQPPFMTQDPMQYLINRQRKLQQSKGQQAQNSFNKFQQKYLGLIQSFDNSKKPENSVDIESISSNRISNLLAEQQLQKHLLLLYQEESAPGEVPQATGDFQHSQQTSYQFQPIQLELDSTFAATAADTVGMQRFSPRNGNSPNSTAEKTKLTKKQIKYLWLLTQQKKVLKRIKRKQPVFSLIKTGNGSQNRPPIAWQSLKEKLSVVQQQIKQHLALFQKYKNKKTQPSILELSKQKYLELIERKKQLTEQSYLLSALSNPRKHKNEHLFGDDDFEGIETSFEQNSDFFNQLYTDQPHLDGLFNNGNQSELAPPYQFSNVLIDFLKKLDSTKDLSSSAATDQRQQELKEISWEPHLDILTEEDNHALLQNPSSPIARLPFTQRPSILSANIQQSASDKLNSFSSLHEMPDSLHRSNQFLCRSVEELPNIAADLNRVKLFEEEGRSSLFESENEERSQDLDAFLSELAPTAAASISQQSDLLDKNAPIQHLFQPLRVDSQRQSQSKSNLWEQYNHTRQLQ